MTLSHIRGLASTLQASEWQADTMTGSTKLPVPTICEVPHLDAEEHGTHLSQPLRVYSSHALHILLASVHQFMVHYVVGGVPQAIQSTARMQKAGHAAAAVVVLSDAL